MGELVLLIKTRNVTNEIFQSHEILVFITCMLSHSLYMYIQLSSGARSVNYGLSLHQQPSVGSDKTAFAQAFSEPKLLAYGMCQQLMTQILEKN